MGVQIESASGGLAAIRCAVHEGPQRAESRLHVQVQHSTLRAGTGLSLRGAQRAAMRTSCNFPRLRQWLLFRASGPNILADTAK
jgi:hypothetical protein